METRFGDLVRATGQSGVGVWGSFHGRLVGGGERNSRRARTKPSDVCLLDVGATKLYEVRGNWRRLEPIMLQLEVVSLDDNLENEVISHAWGNYRDPLNQLPLYINGRALLALHRGTGEGFGTRISAAPLCL
jgi:hypothetical protein